MDRKLLAIRTTFAKRRRSTALQFHSGIRPEPLVCRNILLVEHRDEEYRRLAADLTAAGLQVTGARHAAGAMKECVRCSTDLLVANFALPDSSGWLLTAKARLVSPTRAFGCMPPGRHRTKWQWQNSSGPMA